MSRVVGTQSAGKSGQENGSGGAGPLQAEDILAYSPPVLPNYPDEPSLNFDEYKNQISLLLSHFFEDIVTVKEKTAFLETIVHNSLKSLLKPESLPEDLKDVIAAKIDRLAGGFDDGLITDREYLLRREPSVHAPVLPHDLNLDYIQTYLQNKLAPLLPEIYKSFYKAPAGPYDSKLVNILQKIEKLFDYISNTSENNVLSKVNFHYIEILTFLFSGNNKEDLSKMIPSLVCLDMRNIVENVLGGGGKEWMQSKVTGRGALDTRDEVIDKCKATMSTNPTPFLMNLEVIFKLKLLRDKIGLKHELYSHITKAL